MTRSLPSQASILTASSLTFYFPFSWAGHTLPPTPRSFVLNLSLVRRRYHLHQDQAVLEEVRV